MANWAFPQRVPRQFLVSITIVLAGLRLGRAFVGRSHAQELAAMLQLLFAVSIAEEPVIANAVESTGENVEEESPDELLRRESHGFLLIVVTVVPPVELDLSVFDIQAVDGWKSRLGGCSGPGSRPLAEVRRRAVWRRRPISGSAADRDNGGKPGDLEGPREKKRSRVGRRRRPPADSSRTICGTGRTAPVRARRNWGGKESNGYRRGRSRHPERHNAGGDERAGSVPNCAVQRRNRSRRPDVWDRQRWCTRSRPWLGTECRRRDLCSGKP